MITRFVTRFDSARESLLSGLQSTPPEDYADLFKRLVVAITGDEYGSDDEPDPDRIHCIDDGGYQGMMLFVVGAKGYQPRTYWATMVDYGSCSGCDTFQSIRAYSDDTPTPEQANEYITLMLHMLQRMRCLTEVE